MAKRVADDDDPVLIVTELDLPVGTKKVKRTEPDLSRVDKRLAAQIKDAAIEAASIGSKRPIILECRDDYYDISVAYFPRNSDIGELLLLTLVRTAAVDMGRHIAITETIAMPKDDQLNVSQIFRGLLNDRIITLDDLGKFYTLNSYLEKSPSCEGGRSILERTTLDPFLYHHACTMGY